MYSSVSYGELVYIHINVGSVYCIGVYRMGGVVYTNLESVYKSEYEGGVVYIQM